MLSFLNSNFAQTLGYLETNFEQPGPYLQLLHATPGDSAHIAFKSHRLFRDMLCVKFPTFCGRNPSEVCVTTLSLNWISLFKSGKELNWLAENQRAHYKVRNSSNIRLFCLQWKVDVYTTKSSPKIIDPGFTKSLQWFILFMYLGLCFCANCIYILAKCRELWDIIAKGKWNLLSNTFNCLVPMQVQLLQLSLEIKKSYGAGL